jgi:hypothetical protein
MDRNLCVAETITLSNRSTKVSARHGEISRSSLFPEVTLKIVQVATHLIEIQYLPICTIIPGLKRMLQYTKNFAYLANKNPILYSYAIRKLSN